MRALRFAAALAAWGALFGLLPGGCDAPGQGTVPLEIPHGALARLEQMTGGRLQGFGPFVGYYFRPRAPGDFSVLDLWCFNERGFYASDAPVNALLYTGEARLSKLPETDFSRPAGDERIRPVFFDDAPAAWLVSRPQPQELFVHFHSLYDRTGATDWGYWLRHDARRTFTYDMGGRIAAEGPLYHKVEPGPDAGFARIVEFDYGPR